MNKNVKRLVEGAETIILSTENGMLIKGDMESILSMLSKMFRQMREELVLNKEMIIKTLDLAFETEEKILEEVLQLIKAIKEKEGEEDDE